MNFPHEYYLLPTEERKKILDAEVKISDNIARVKISDNEAQIKISYNEVIKKQAELLMTYKRDSKMIQEFLTSTPLGLWINYYIFMLCFIDSCSRIYWHLTYYLIFTSFYITSCSPEFRKETR